MKRFILVSGVSMIILLAQGCIRLYYATVEGDIYSEIKFCFFAEDPLDNPNAKPAELTLFSIGVGELIEQGTGDSQFEHREAISARQAPYIRPRPVWHLMRNPKEEYVRARCIVYGSQLEGYSPSSYLAEKGLTKAEPLEKGGKYDLYVTGSHGRRSIIVAIVFVINENGVARRVK